MAQKLEQDLDKEIMLYCGEMNAACFHTNVIEGEWMNMKTKKISWLKSGLPKGWPDLMIVPHNKPVFYCETKIHPRKPTAEQIKRINWLLNKGHLAFVAYSLEEFKEKSKNAL